MPSERLSREKMLDRFASGVVSIRFGGATYTTAGDLPSSGVMGSQQYDALVVEPVGGTIEVGTLNVEGPLPVTGPDAAGAPITGNPLLLGFGNSGIPTEDIFTVNADHPLPVAVIGNAAVVGGQNEGDDPAGGPLYLFKDAAGKVAVPELTGAGAVPVALISPASEIVVFASGAQANTYTSADLTNPGAAGVAVVFDVTDVPSVVTATLSIQAKDGASGKYLTLLTGAAVVTTGTARYVIYPGLTPVANTAVNDVLGTTWRVLVTHSAPASFTYSLGAVYLA